MVSHTVGQLRERFAGGASGEQSELTRIEQFLDAAAVLASHVPTKKSHSGVVRHAGVLHLLIEIDSCVDLDARLQKAVRQSARTAEEIDGADGTVSREVFETFADRSAHHAIPLGPDRLPHQGLILCHSFDASGSEIESRCD